MASDSENFGGDSREHKQYRERQNALTESDADMIKSIVESALHAKVENHRLSADCRFSNITPQDLEETVKFCRKFNEGWDDSKSVVRRTLIALLIGGVFALMGWGAVAKIKAGM